MSRRAGALALALLFLAIGLTAVRPAYAQTVTATDTASLNTAIADVNAGTATTISITADITLSAALKAINTSNSITINGNGHTLDGGGSQRGLFVYSGTVAINSVTIQNAKAAGGAGSEAGGGGAGLGGALFIANGASVTVSGVTLSSNNGTGGTGGAGTFGAGGGGGLGGAGASSASNGGGGGGGGIGGNGGTGGGGGGSAGIVSGAGSGGAGSGPGGGGGGSGGGGGGGNVVGGGGGGIGGSDGNFSGDGGAGGFGGGGGGAEGGATNNAGAGGFGGGGGGSNGGSGGAGGFGGGGGGFTGCTTCSAGTGGFGAGAGGAGDSSARGAGGGGLGAGGAIFVQQGGSLTLAGSLTVNGNTVTGGAGGTGAAGGGSGGSGSAYGAGLFLQGSGTVTFSPATGVSQTVSDAIADQGGNGGSGSWTLAKSGAGTLVLSGSNTYSGGTTVSGGTLSISADSNLGSGGTLALKDGTALAFTTGGSYTHSITVAGDPTFDVASGQTVTQSGVIADGASAGDVTKTGAGTLVLSGANTYTGGTTVSAGTLRLSGSGTLGSIAGALTVNGGTLDLNGVNQTVGSLAGTGGTITLGSGALTVDQSSSTTYSGAISGTGSLIKAGSGTLILDGTNTYGGGTTVSGGTLEIGDASDPGASIAGDVTVNSSGILAGHGTIGGAVTNGGTVSPGGSIGTLTVGGNYTQSSAGTLAIELSPGAASRLAVTGSASLAGTLKLTFDSGTYASGTKYKILTAGGGVSGTFATTTVSGLLGLSESVSYLANEIDVSLVSTGAGSVASTLGFQQAAFADAQVATATVMQHLDQIGQGTDGVFTATAGAVPVQLAFGGGAEELAAALTRLPDSFARNGGWFRTSGTFANIDTQGSIAGYHSSRGAFLAGFDRQLTPDLIAGIAAGYGRTHADIHDEGGSTATIDTPRGFIYGRYLLPAAYVDASVGYAFDRIDMMRPVANVGTTATSRHDGHEVSLAVETGRPCSLGWATLTPKLGFQYLHLGEDGYSEEGADTNDLTVASHDADSFRPLLGASLGRAFAADDGTRIVPEARASYSRELLNVTHEVTEQDASGSGPTAVVGLNPGRNIVGLGGGVAVAASDRLALFADYDANLSPGFATVQTVSAGVRMRF